MRNWARRSIGTAGVGALLALTATGVATATGEGDSGPQDEPLWYLEETGIPELQQSATGEGVTIALLDTGVNPDAPALRGADLVGTEFTCAEGEGVVSGFHDDVEAHHGTHLASILVGNGEPVNGQIGIPGIAPDATLISYDIAAEDETTRDVQEEFTCENRTYLYRDAVLDAIDRDVDLIVTAVGRSVSADAATAVIRAINAGIVVVAANENMSEFSMDSRATGVEIEKFNGVVSVENATQTGAREDPVVGPWITVLAPGTGYPHYSRGTGGWDELTYSAAANSPATAYVGGVLALVKSAYPDATGNQLIQALVRGADGGNPDLVRTDENGYGFISPRTMIATDPTTFPDENPLLREEEGTWPLLADFEDGVFTDDTWDYPLEGDPVSADAAASAEDGGLDTSSLFGTVLVVAGVLLGLVVVGGIVTLVLVRRSKHR